MYRLVVLFPFFAGCSDPSVAVVDAVPDTTGIPLAPAPVVLRPAYDLLGTRIADVRLSLTTWGRGDEPLPRPAIQPTLDPAGSVRFDADGLVEWWHHGTPGLEHGFTLTSAPPGHELLFFELTLTGASAEVDASGTCAQLTRSGAPLTYCGLAAWDARGTPLDAWMEPSATGLTLWVDDADAVGPITVDPLVSLGWTAESDQSLSYFGRTVASAGDVNGDGFADVIAGAYRYDGGSLNEGLAVAFYGSASGLGTSWDWSVESDKKKALFGGSVATAGDVNGDGYDDVIVGANGLSNGKNGEGAAFVYHGSPTGLDTTAAWSAEGNQAGAAFGLQVASAGDVNGDGYDDVIVGAWHHDGGQNDEGRAYVYLGSATGLAATAAWTAEPDQAGALYGVSVASAGDVDGDGYDDVIVGSSGYDDLAADEGRADVYLGSATGLDSAPAWTVTSGEAGAELGFSVASAGDVNGDGFSDVILGVYRHDGGETDEGQALLYLGSAGGLAATPAWSGEPDQDEAWYGYQVAGAGDVNGDGYGDVLVGAWKYDDGETDEGRAYLYLGSANGLEAGADWSEESDQLDARYGESVASAGDVDGDGLADVVVGAPRFDAPQMNEGRLYLYLGAP